MYSLAEKLNLIRGTLLCSHITERWGIWLVSQESPGYLSSEFLATHLTYCHAIQFHQGAVNISAEITILEIVQMLVSAPKELRIKCTFLLFSIFLGCFISDYISRTEGTFKILHLILCKHVLWEEERIMTIDKKPGDILWFISSYYLSLNDRHCTFKVTIDRL